MTDRQKQLFNYLKGYIREHGYGPTYIEMRKAMKVTNNKTVGRWLFKLREDGHVNWTFGKERSIVLLGEFKSINNMAARRTKALRAYNPNEPEQADARNFGWRADAPEWEEVLAGRRFDEPDMMVVIKETPPKKYSFTKRA